jgi:hypothetical protein
MAGGATMFDMGTWKTEGAMRKSADGTASFVAVGTELLGLDVVTGTTAGKPTLTVRDAQHDYVFEAG